MSRSVLSLSPEQLTSFDLKAFVTHAHALNQQHLEAFTTPFPKASSRWLTRSTQAAVPPNEDTATSGG